jgi:hypothetical protein
MLSDREQVTEFIKAHAKESSFSIEERLDLDASGVDFDVLEEYLRTKLTRARMRLTDVNK